MKVIDVGWPKVFLGIALVSTIAGALYATYALFGIEKNIAAAKEAARPANVKLTKITIANCQDCFNVEDALSTFKKQNVIVDEEKSISYDSSEGQTLIKDLGITRIPTYVAAGEVKKSNLEGFIKGNGEIKNDTFIFTKVTPVFLDTETGKEMGKVIATILTDPTCTQCVDPKLTVEAYKKAGIKVTDQKSVSWNSAEGKQIIAQYKITKVPTFLLSPDADFYDSVKANWAQIGTVEQDKTYVARNLFLPYRDLEKGQIVGLVDAIYLTDATCADCYKPQESQKNILTRGYGVAILSERTIDTASQEGLGLINQYKITKIPTVLLSPEVSEYAAIKNVWKSVGTVEQNGWYVFRQMQQLGAIVYKDLTSGQIVRPQQAANSQPNQ